MSVDPKSTENPYGYYAPGASGGFTPPPGAYDAVGSPGWPTPSHEPVRWGRQVVAGVVTTLVMVLIGAPLGLLWGHLAPRLDITLVDQAAEQAFKTHFADDMTFLLICALAGIVCGAVAWRLARGRDCGPGLAVGIVVGGLLAALVAARVGFLLRKPELFRDLRAAHVPADVISKLDKDAVGILEFRLRSLGMLVILPLVALATATGLTMWIERPRPGQSPAAPPQESARWWAAPQS